MRRWASLALYASPCRNAQEIRSFATSPWQSLAPQAKHSVIAMQQSMKYFF
jgi:hypothetical protein